MDLTLVTITLNKIIIMFVMILVGAVSAKTGLISGETKEKLANILVMLVLPLMLFSSYQKELRLDQLKGLLMAFLLAWLAHLTGIILSKLAIRRRPGGNLEIERMNVIYANAAFIGTALSYSIFGPDGVFYIAGYVTVCNILMWTHGVILISGQREIKDLRPVLTSPCLISVLLGIILYLLQVRLPAFILEPITTIAGMSLPLSMLVAGAILAETKIWRLLGRFRLYYILFLRMLAVPLVMLAALKLWPAPPPDIVAVTVLIGSGCPSASTIIILSLRYRRNYVYASEIFGLSTLFCIFTIPLVVFFYGWL